MKSPAILFYTSDFLTGTTLMTYTQKGKYIHLLCLQHQQGHLTAEDFFSIVDPNDIKVLSKFIKDENGNYYNERMEEETQKRVAYSQSRASNRVKKSLKTKENGTNNICKSYDEHMENENDNILGSNSIKEIIEYLNLRLSTSYKYNSSKNISVITARLNENYTLDDFKTVIDKKADEWLDTEMEKFLRPETLFGTKFESYLNQKIIKKETAWEKNRRMLSE